MEKNKGTLLTPIFGKHVDFFECVLFYIEWISCIIPINIILLLIVDSQYFYYVLFAMPIFLVTMISSVYVGSHFNALNIGFKFNQPALRNIIEQYIETGEGDLDIILENNHYPSKFSFNEINYLIKDLITQTLLHLDIHNKDNIAEGYNKGNDWFEATLGEMMVYTSAIYKTGTESLIDAQKYKLDYVANAIDINTDDKILDIGCGWGRLVQHFSDNYNAKVTGITLSSAQVEYGRTLNKHNNSKIYLQDAMKLNQDLYGTFNKITSLEMAEHVGIKRYGQFLKLVYDLLDDDGIFYFQVAGLRRQWEYEDLIWGLFMAQYIFPGADASCPLGWVTTQLERSGFEVQRVQNFGSHYSITLKQWLNEWHKNKDLIVNKYGIKSYRKWEVFLKWSVRIARQGSSTVFMITATKQKKEKARLHIQKHLAPIY